MIRAFSLEHAPYEDPVYITQWLKGHNIRITSIKLFEGDSLPDISEVNLLIIMGGPMNIYEEEKYPWLPGEKKFIKDAILADIPILGICLGGQLIADVLGGKVTKAPIPEYGWHTVNRLPEIELPFLREEATASSPFPMSLIVFQWHQDTFSIPPGSLPLYASERCRNQAFIYKDKIIGLQFHPEMDPKTIQAFLSLSTTIKELEMKGQFPIQADILCKLELCAHGNEFIGGLLKYLILSIKGINTKSYLS
jgi:GMP synthase (glutamine-hydrolysing)